MSKLIDIQSQIESLQKQAAAIKAKEFDSTVLEIKAKMAAFGITIKDIQAPSKVKGAGKAVKAAKAPKAAKVKAKVAVKYRGPAGETWSGRGLMPKWLSTLVKAGSAQEQFLVNASTVADAPAA